MCTRHVSSETDKKKGRETTRDRTCQDGKMRKEVNWECKKWNEEIEMGKERSIREKKGWSKNNMQREKMSRKKYEGKREHKGEKSCL